VTAVKFPDISTFSRQVVTLHTTPVAWYLTIITKLNNTTDREPTRVTSTRSDSGLKSGCLPDHSQNVVDSLPCRCQSFRWLSWKSAGDCMRNANKSPQIPYFTTWGNWKSDLASVSGRQTDIRQIDGRQTDVRQTDGRQTDIRQTDGKQTDIRQTDGRQTDGRETDVRQTDGRQTDIRQTDGRQTLVARIHRVTFCA